MTTEEYVPAVAWHPITNVVAYSAVPEPVPVEDVAQPATKKRPRLDLAVGGPQRKRGKSMFGLVIGTLNKAKIEDKERSASEAVRVSLLPFPLPFLPSADYTPGEKTATNRTAAAD